MRCRILIGLMVAGVVAVTAPAMAGSAEDAAKAFAEGKELLAKGDFAGASQAFKRATKDDPENVEYRQSFAMLRQVVRLREQLETEADSSRWTAMATALRSFYHAQGIHTESLVLNRKMHERAPSAETASALAENLLTLDMDSEALAILQGVKTDQVTDRVNVLLAIATARQGKVDEAKLIVRKVSPADDADPQLLSEFARAQALTGNKSEALKALGRSFEQTPPGRLADAKAEAKASKDFRSIANDPSFARVLEIDSKIAESSCSKGDSCGSCPKRKKAGGCGGCSNAKQAEESSAGTCPHAKKKSCPHASDD